MSKQLPEVGDITGVLLKYKQLSVQELEFHLAITKAEESDFKRLIKKLVSQKVLKMSDDHLLSLLSSAVLCIYQANREGRGGVAIEVNTKQSLLINPGNENFAIDGDEVAVITEVGVDKTGQPTASVQSIIKHKITNLVGRIEQYKDKYYLVSDISPGECRP